MPLKAGDAARFEEILRAAVIAERMFLRVQFEADGTTPEGRAEIERAQNARRQAIGLRKAIEDWPT